MIKLLFLLINSLCFAQVNQEIFSDSGRLVVVAQDLNFTYIVNRQSKSIQFVTQNESQWSKTIQGNETLFIPSAQRGGMSILNLQGPPLQLIISAQKARFKVEGTAAESKFYIAEGSLALMQFRSPFAVYGKKVELSLLDTAQFAFVDVYQLNLNSKNHQGKIEVHHHLGQVTLEQLNGALNYTGYAAQLKLLKSNASADVKQQRGGISFSQINGRVTIKSQDSNLQISGLNQGDWFIDNKSGKTNVQFSNQQKIAFDIVTQKGDLLAPATFKINKSEGEKSLRQKLSEEAIFDLRVKSVEGSVNLRN